MLRRTVCRSVLARQGDVQRSFGVRITRATTINPFAGLGAGRQFPDAGQPSIALRCYEPWTVSERSFFARVPPRCEVFRARERMFGMRGDDRDAALCSYADRGWPPAASPLMPGCSREVYRAE